MIPETAEIGYDVPALPGMAVAEVVTPALIVDLEAFERNIERMRAFVAARGLRLRAHAKTHKSADIALIQMQRGGACGICCQKVSEAEALVRAGVPDVLVSNEIHGARRAARLARLAGHARVAVCVDDAGQVACLSAAAAAEGSGIGVLVEIDCGGGRCGAPDIDSAVALGRQVMAAPGLRLDGIQAYQGRLQHVADAAERRAGARAAAERMRAVRDAFRAAGLPCETVSGGGTGSFELDAEMGVLTELQCGSYIFGDADYGRIGKEAGSVLESLEPALFVLAEVMSHQPAGRAICDAGLKAHAVDSGLPVLRDSGARLLGASDEHGAIDDPDNRLRAGDRIWLIPGHCDPTCNLHDWYVAVRDGRVEALWPVTARGKLF